MIDEALNKFLPKSKADYSLPVYQAMNYSLFSGGKRLRPTLTLLASEAVGGQSQNVLPTACAVEYLHTYSLIHDDLPCMDDDDLRRGQPSCHKKFGEAIAVLAGDALLTEAFGLIASFQPGKPETVLDVIAKLAEAVGSKGMIGGQAADINAWLGNTTEEQLELIYKNKTGALMVAALESGAMLAGGSPQQLNSLRNYGGYLGMIFQITDDLIDELPVQLDKSATEKSPGKLRASFLGLLGDKFCLDYLKRLECQARDELRESQLVNKDKLGMLLEMIVRRRS